jgi:putative peptidoglycan lipid II flippase
MFKIILFCQKIKNNVVLQNTLKLSMVSIGANIIGFLIPIYIAFEYAISKETDDFFLSYSIIIFMSTIFSSALRSVSVPFLIEKSNNKFEFNQFISTVFYFATFFFFILSVILGIIAYSTFFFTEKLIYWYLLLSVPILFFTVLNSFCYGILNSLNQFYVAEMSPFSRGIIILLSIFFLRDYVGISAVIIGYNLGEFVKFIHLFFLIIKKNSVNITLIKDFRIIKDFVKKGSVLILTTTFSSASPLIDRLTASFLIAGSVTLLDYGDRLYVVFFVILNSFLVIVLSKWSKDILENNFSINELNKIVYIILCLTSFALVIVFFSKSLIVNTLYPNLSMSNKLIIEYVLVLNMIGFIFNAVSQVINRATIALKASNIMIKTSIIKFLFNIVLNVIFVKIWGFIGIIISTIGVHIIGLAVNYFLFSKLVLVKKRNN